ncbi:hypothetical protein LCY76_23560 [Fictibacillus sp. KIGAM418]|uniref:Uncharacterized protein n=1 Tax=Fictibacillus marinisediminis TaxID=2878389 RepID=A0A9X1XGM7_9BACL|nr:hypothetical protein [Fictibacillus marinisediminis]MCK6259550.1 hypothetical protein [Fictibacillus marinisediminis]
MSSSLNPMFKTTRPVLRNSQQLDQPPTQKRKKRIDAKHDIRIPISHELKGRLRLLGNKQNKSLTYIGTTILTKGLRHCNFQQFRYEDSEIIVHAKVQKEIYNQIFKLAIEWDCSVRKAAHRIFFNQLMFESEVSLSEGI